ncbi:hypothetical protein GOODEAATRI_034242 [Goodea atripinnis]|uniref:Uncharacterized protein n=1 Tax=Goodea atripinnis TaxID=208336 RepID=A0ABV0PJN8_9TELE
MYESTRYTNSDSFVLILLHMIDDRMTLSDPVEELCLFARKETLVRCASPVPVLQGSSGRERFLGKGVLLYGQWHHGKSTVSSPFLSCWKSVKCNLFLKFQKSLYRIFHVVSMTVGPYMINNFCERTQKYCVGTQKTIYCGELGDNQGVSLGKKVKPK